MRLRAVLMMILVSLILVSCGMKESVQIGFVGTLSGPNSSIGIAMRDGLLLKVEEVNEQGGIDGRLIELIIKDDKNDSDLIKAINKELIERGIGIIFGHELSSKAAPLFEMIEGKEIIVMSPTLSTYEVSGLDDNFFRTIPSNYDQGIALGEYATGKSKKTLLVYDNNNKKFADGVNEGFIDHFAGEAEEYPVDESLVNESERIVDVFMAGNFDSVMYVMNPNDVMFMSQVFFKNNIDVDIYSSNWGMAINELDEGGRAIEGAAFVSFMGNLDGPRYLSFRDAYFGKYQKEPEFAAVYSYEASTMLFEALKNSDKLEYQDVKDNLLSLGEMEGLVSPLKLDEYGDVKRDLFLAVVVDGELVTLE